MKTALKLWLVCSLLFPVFAMSREIGRDIEFPKNYDPAKAAAIRQVIRDPKFHFVGGLVSYWPPDWATRLSYTGDAASLNQFMAGLRRLPGVGLRLKLYRGQHTELRQDSPWQLEFSHAHPDELTLLINLNCGELDLAGINFPIWPPAPK